MKIFRSALFIVTVVLIISACENTDPPGFEILSIDESLRKEMISKGVFGSHSPVPIERLRLVRVKYVDFDDREWSGEIMVMDACTEQVRQLFIELYQVRFSMAEVTLITAFDGSDSLSMASNNTSAHNLRPITGGERLSLHAYGTAIDINPVQNPFIDIPCDDSLGIATIEPIAGSKFANRMENRLGKKNRKGMAEEVIDIFARNGFYWWGGYWNCPIDYQHFQISRSVTELLALMKPDEARAFFITVQNYFNTTNEPIEYALEAKIGEERSLKEIYSEDPEEFNRIIDDL